MSNTINSQISDSVILSNEIVSSLSPSIAMGLTNMTMADTIGLVMHDAVIAQKGMQTVANAAVTQACVLILSVGAAKAK